MSELGKRSRREFLRHSIAAVAAGGALQMASQGQEPSGITRPEWTIACRDAHLPETGEADCWSAMKAIGVDGVEVVVDFDLACPSLKHPSRSYGIADGARIRELGADAERAGRKIVAFCLINRFDERPDEEVAFTARVARAAAELGVPVVRLDYVARKLNVEDEAFLDLAVETGRRIVEETDGLPVAFGVENHAHATNRPAFLRKLFDGVGSDRFGLTLDTANFYWYGFPLDELYAIYESFAPQTFHTHCKNICYPEDRRNVERPIGWEYGKYCCPVDEGDIDFRKFAAILRRHGYRGALCIENESLGRFPQEERPRILKREADLLRRIAAEV